VSNKKKTIKKPILKNLLLVFIFLVAVFIGIYTFLHLFTRHGKGFVLPDFYGLTVDRAKAKGDSLQLHIEVADSLYMPELPKGIVFRQVPPAGQHVKKNRRVELTINSLLPRQVKMPSLVGYSLRQAKAELSSHGLKTGRLRYVPDIATNNVLEQYHKGYPIEPGTLLDIYSSIDLELGLSPNSEPAYIPLLKGKSLETALDILSDHSLNIGSITYDNSVLTAADTLAARVFKQNPPFSLTPEWPLGTVVHLSLTVNPEMLVHEEIPSEEENR
jgi:beta-lactam-binding protein with PASTA domain